MNSKVANLYPKPTPGVAAMEKLTVSSSAIQFANRDTYSNLTKYIVVDEQGADAFVNYTNGQEAPSANAGHRLYAGRSYTWDKETARAAKFIRVSVDSTLMASEFTD